MNVERKEAKFTPITITLESEDEFRAMLEIVRWFKRYSNPPNPSLYFAATLASKLISGVSHVRSD